MPKAQITLTLKAFNANGCCQIDKLDISPGGGGNRIRKKNPGDPNDHTIIIKGKGNAQLDVEFAITGFRVRVTPLPITFSGANAAGNFTGQTVNADGSVRVTDTFADVGDGPSNPSWGYTIAIVDGNGTPALIDPAIENEAL